MFGVRVFIGRIPMFLGREMSKSVHRGKLPRAKAIPYGSTNLPFMPTILNQMRQDVLINPTFKDRVIFVKKSWLALSPVSESAVKALKKAVESGKDNAVDEKSVLFTLSDKDLVLFVGELVHIQPLPVDDKHLQVIERECCHRACHLDTVSLLTVADAFYMMGYQFWVYFSVLASQIEFRWESLKIKKQDVLQLAFYISYLRKAPIHLMHKIEKFVYDNLDEFSGNDIGLVCHAFFATNTSFRNYSLLDRITRTILSDLRKDQLRPYLLSNILKSLRHVHFLNTRFYDELGQCLCQVKPNKVHLTTSDLANIASTYSSLRVVNPELFAFIGSAVMKLAQESKLVRWSFRTKDLCRLIWSFGQLCEPVDHTICNILVDKLKNDEQLAYKYPEVFVEALVALAMQQIYPRTLFDVLFSQSFLKLKSKRLLEQQFQSLLLKAAYGIECLGSDSIQELDGKPIGNLASELSTRQGLMSLITSLSEKLLSPANLRCHFILPHSRITDIEIRLDQRNQPQPFNSKLSDFAAIRDVGGNMRVYHSAQQGGIVKQLLDQSNRISRVVPENIYVKPSVPVSQRRITIKVMGWNQFAANKPLLLGIHRMELRLLTRLGYEVYVINPEEAQQLDAMNDSQRALYVENLCNELVINPPIHESGIL